MLGVSKLGSALSHGLVAAPTKAHFSNAAEEGGELFSLGMESQMRRELSYSSSPLQPRMEATAILFFFFAPTGAAAPRAARSLCHRGMGSTHFGPPR